MAIDPSKYSDNRQSFFREYFERALPYDQYVVTGSSAHQERWRNAENIELSKELKSVVHGFKRKLNILCMSGTWCGDCARQGPMLKLIASSSSCIDLRFIDNRANPELQAELKINGADKVPVVVLLSEDFFELARFGDKHLSQYRKAVRTQLGAVCDTGLIAPAADDLLTELTEWVGFIERVELLLRLSPLLRDRYAD